MSLGKRDISKNISSKTQISSKQSLDILNKFIEFISTNSNKRDVKISNFGTFYIHHSPKRLGRNPKTKQEFVIPKRSKLSLKVSSYVKNSFN
tara:strand:+ start:391 stop:666 length:276 start_codon:yes stop_codon:yes gene_type:complete